MKASPDHALKFSSRTYAKPSRHLPRLTFRDRIALGMIATGLVLAAFMPGCDPKPIEEVCADKVGVHWSRDQGATEELEAFMDCVNDERGR